MAMIPLLRLLEWLAARAGASLAADAGSAPWDVPSNADRAGSLLPVPQEGLEPELSRSLGHWALWLAVGIVLVILAVGYVRRRWRGRREVRPGWLTRRGLR